MIFSSTHLITMARALAGPYFRWQNPILKSCKREIVPPRGEADDQPPDLDEAC
jgi:hypothetical protein